MMNKQKSQNESFNKENPVKKWYWRYRNLLWLLLPALFLCLMISFTLQDGPESTGLSKTIVAKILGRLAVLFDAPQLLDNKKLWSVLHTLLRKGAHFTEYAVLCGLLFRAQGFVKSIKALNGGPLRYLTALVLTVLVASMDETLQYFVPGRESKATDVLIDAAGALLALVLIFLYRRKKNKVMGKLKNSDISIKATKLNGNARNRT